MFRSLLGLFSKPIKIVILVFRLLGIFDAFLLSIYHYNIVKNSCKFRELYSKPTIPVIQAFKSVCSSWMIDDSASIYHWNRSWKPGNPRLFSKVTNTIIHIVKGSFLPLDWCIVPVKLPLQSGTHSWKPGHLSLRSDETARSIRRQMVQESGPFLSQTSGIK